MWTLLLAACIGGSAPRPTLVPSDAVVVSVVDGTVLVDGAPAAKFSDLATDPTAEEYPALARALTQPEGAKPSAAWVELPPDTPFYLVRRVLGSVRAAGRTQTLVSASGGTDVYPLNAGPRYALRGGCDAPLVIRDLAPLISISLQTGADGQWMVATARLLPITDKGPTDGYDRRCLTAPPCAELYPESETLRTACEAGATGAASERVGLAGQYGCMLPIAREPAGVGEWRELLPALLTSLGFDAKSMVLVMPEARTRLDALLAVLGGFGDAGLPVPAVGATLLVEGNDGPPVCNAPVRDKASFDAAKARYLGLLGSPVAP